MHAARRFTARRVLPRTLAATSLTSRRQQLRTFADETPLAANDAADGKKLAVDFADVAQASFRIKDSVRNTSCERSTRCSVLTGVDLYFKSDKNQVTGSFKERGARNALLELGEVQRSVGVITASAGNHALALAYHAGQLGIPVTCIMPVSAPLTKVNRCKEYGATVELEGDHIGEARERAMQLVGENGYSYINGFDDPAIIAGAGTMALEILEQVDGLQAIVVPVGGGGLIAGIATVIKSMRPEIEVIGVEPEACASMSAALAAGAPVPVAYSGTIADGLAVPHVGPNAFAIVQEKVDRVVTVSEKSIALA
jgi:threonine dehydratase